jgi:hypothetical protein
MVQIDMPGNDLEFIQITWSYSYLYVGLETPRAYIFIRFTFNFTVLQYLYLRWYSADVEKHLVYTNFLKHAWYFL